MSEPTNNLTRTILLRYVGRMLPVSRASADWSGTTIDDDVDDYVASGERGFYYHDMILPGEQTVHSWSFLRQQLSVGIVDGVWQYDLPDDFGGFISNELAFATDDLAGAQVQLVDIDLILEKRSLELPELATYPTLAAVVNIPNSGARGPRQALAVYPTPSAARRLIGTYTFNPNGITSTTPYPFGGQQHAETLIESCLSAAELFNNDEEGPHTKKFRRLLAASIYRDRATTTPKFFGYNGNDNSRNQFRRHTARDVTYESSS